MEKLIKRFIVTSIIIAVCAYYKIFIYVSDIKYAIIASVYITLLFFLINIATKFLAKLGCFTLGISYLVSLFLSIFALPISIYLSQDYVDYFIVKDYTSAIILSVMIAIAQSMIVYEKK